MKKGASSGIVTGIGRGRKRSVDLAHYDVAQHGTEPPKDTELLNPLTGEQWEFGRGDARRLHDERPRRCPFSIGAGMGPS